MKYFSALKLTINWKQALLYELSLFSLGIIIGSLWPNIFTGAVLWAIIAVFLIAGGYITALWIRQNKDIFSRPEK